MHLPDGPNTECANVTFVYVTITPNLLQNSLTLTVSGATKEDILSPLGYNRLRQAIASINGALEPRDVLIFSVQQQLEAGKETEPQVNVSISVLRTEEEYFRWVSSSSGAHQFVVFALSSVPSAIRACVRSFFFR